MASLILGSLPMASHSLSLSSRLSISQSEALTVSLSTSPFSIATSSPSFPLVYCGRGDRKTAKGKRFNHSFGNARPHKKNKGRGPARVPVPPTPIKKDQFDDNEKIKIDIDESLFNG